MLSKSTLAADAAEKSRKLFESCVLCGHRCGVNRMNGEKGVCGAGDRMKVSSVVPHFGEEPFISGDKGSGAIFFSLCNLNCVFCQNHEISQRDSGEEISAEDLGRNMLLLQERGCHNINLVSPTHFMPLILDALKISFENGLKIPLVYNTGGFDSVELIRILDGIIDIYMPDLKFLDGKLAKRYSNAGNYPDTAKEAIKEMFRQVGNIVFDENEIAVKGLLARHLVLPGAAENSKMAMEFMASISKEMWISIMSQYNPMNRAKEFPEISGKLDPKEYWQVIEKVQDLRMENYLIQEMESSDVYVPDFSKEDPFEATGS